MKYSGAVAKAALSAVTAPGAGRRVSAHRVSSRITRAALSTCAARPAARQAATRRTSCRRRCVRLSAALTGRECFGIPYLILVPKGWRNLWAAGRCNSSDLRMHGTIRVQPDASMMGQVAGNAAAQSLSTGQPANDLATARLVETLRGAGVYLPQEKLSRKMTRA